MNTQRMSRQKSEREDTLHIHTDLSALVSDEVVEDAVLSQAQVPVQVNRVNVML